MILLCNSRVQDHVPEPLTQLCMQNVQKKLTNKKKNKAAIIIQCPIYEFVRA